VSRLIFETITSRIRQELCHNTHLLVRVTVNGGFEMLSKRSWTTLKMLLSSRLRNPTITSRSPSRKSNSGILKYEADQPLIILFCSSVNYLALRITLELGEHNRLTTGYGLDDRGVTVQVPVLSRIFSPARRSGRLHDRPSRLSTGHRGLFPWG
jgi:hypothetical protein